MKLTKEYSCNWDLSHHEGIKLGEGEAMKSLGFWVWILRL